MTETILAAVAVDSERTEVRGFPKPAPHADDGLLKVEITGICGADWPYYVSAPRNKGPLILGHETVGYVSELGAEAAARWGVKEGDRVALEEYLPCGHCKHCRRGEIRLCPETDILLGGLRYGAAPISLAPSLYGGYSQFQYLHPNAVFHKVPAHVPAEQAALALPLGNGVEWACRQGGAAIGDTVVIQGPGQQGLACVVAAREAGASCIIISGTGSPTDQFRLALARRLGADHSIDIEQQDLLETVADITNGEMGDLVIDCSSGGPSTVVSAIQLAGQHGRVMLGSHKQRPIPEFNSDLILSRCLTVKGMRGHSYDSVEKAIQIIAAGRHPLDAMCTHQFGLIEVDEGLRTVGGKGRPNAVHCTVNPWKS